MGILIDSSVLIEHERGRLDLPALLADFDDEEGFLSAVTASELLHGVHRAATAHDRARRLAVVEALLAAFPVLAVDVAVARMHAQVWADLRAAGQAVGMNDMWLAATCLAHGHAMVTCNQRDFLRIPGLRVHAPA